MKKLLVFGLVISLLIFFTLPTLVFAEPGDESTALGEDPEGQYEMDPNDDDYSDEPEEAPPGDEMEVYCIDEDVSLSPLEDAYTETENSVSEELIEGGEDPDNAVAVEIMSTNATGASDEVNQDVVWSILTSVTGAEKPVSLDEVGQAVKDAVLALAAEFNSLAVNSDEDDENDMTLEDFLAEKDLNSIKVLLEDKPFIEEDGTCNNEFEATAIMEEPLVEGVSDGINIGDASVSPEETVGDTSLEITATGAKTVFWYILEGSFNVSFSPDDLVTETKSGMFDYTDDGTDPDGDGDSSTEDHYGMAKVPYYFYWWGDGFPEFEEMSVNIGAAVDIDEDEMIDKEKGEDLDEFKEDFAVVQTIENPEYDYEEYPGPYNSFHVVEKVMDDDEVVIDEENDVPEVVTEMPENVDIDYYNAGKTVVREKRGLDCQDSAYEDVFVIYRSQPSFGGSSWTSYVINGAPEVIIPEYNYYKYEIVGWRWIFPVWDWVAYTHEEEVIHPEPYDQRFVIESYSEPSDTDIMLYSRWLDFSVNKTDSTNGNPVEGAKYKLEYSEGRSENSYPYENIFEATTGPDGSAVFTNLPWGIYVLSETESPEGYVLNTDTFDVYVGGSCLFNFAEIQEHEYGSIDVEDDPVGKVVITKWFIGKKVDTYFRLRGEDGNYYDRDGNIVDASYTQKVRASYPFGKFFNLAPQKYYLEEVELEGYKSEIRTGWKNGPIGDMVEVKPGKTSYFHVWNTQLGKVHVTKWFEGEKVDTYFRLKGEDGNYYDKDGNIVDSSYTLKIRDSYPHANFKNLIPQTYYLEEVALDGYISEIRTGWKNGPVGDSVVLEPGKTSYFHVWNIQLGSITLEKSYIIAYNQDISTINFYLQSGGTYYKQDGSEASSKADAAVSLAGEGSITWNDLIPNKTYTIEEDTIDGYSQTIDPNGFSLEPGEEKSVEAVNEQIPGVINIHKTDEISGEDLEGAVFGLFMADGVTVAKDFDGLDVANVVTDASGKASFINLAWGTYLVKEITPPTGYLPKETTVTIGAETLEISIEEEIADPRIPGTITIYKYAGANPLGGVVFDVTNGKTGDDAFAVKVTTGDDGIATLSGLAWDTYYIKEASVPDATLYEINPNQFIITISRYNLSDGVDVENGIITTITAGTPPVGVAGISEIEVLGISEELPFTGMNIYIPIAGAGVLIAGMALILSSIRRKRAQVSK